MERLLILDDDPLFCDTLKDRLSRSSETSKWDVTSFTRVEEAVELVKQSAKSMEPIDILLIDQRLENNVDGIDLWIDLHRISPESDAIIFTGLDDPDSWRRAYESGAFRYLPKPFDTRELVLLLQALDKWRKMQRENVWLRVFTSIAEKAEHCSDFKQIAKIIIEGALQLGFERSRLFWKPDDYDPDRGECLIGISQAGREIIQEFEGYHFAIKDSPYTQKALQNRDAIYMQSRQHGPGFLEKEFPGRFSPPIGEWVLLPIWIGDIFKGDIVLDNASEKRILKEEDRQHLHLFTHLVSSILEKSYLYAKEQRSRKEAEVISEITKFITTRAALDDFNTLLDEVRNQIGRLMDVQNFIIALTDEETRRLKFELQYNEGRLVEGHDAPIHEGMTAHLIKLGKELYLPDGNELYIKENNIIPHGKYAKCWIGVPLRIGDTTFGAIALHNHQKSYAYSQRHRELLLKIAEQVAGAIQTARLAERERENARELAILSRASAEFLDLINRDENSFWYALLTITTASYGFKYNRAWLFLSDISKTELVGKLGIGYRKESSARKAWERDVEEGLTFDSSLRMLKAGKLRHTPLDRLTKELKFDLQGINDVFIRVFQTGQRCIVSKAEVNQSFPEAFVKQFDPDTSAVLPVYAGGEVIGIIVVDDKFDQRSIRGTSLDRLEALLSIAGQAWQNLRYRRKLEAQQEATYAIMGEASNRPLGETLTQICKSALTIGDADCSIIYPLKPDIDPPVYDVENMGKAGHITKFDLSTKPRQRGISAHILRSGKMVVSDTLMQSEKFEGLHLVDHPFLKRENIRAFIGLPVKDPNTQKLLGILYLDYRSPRHFTLQDVSWAESFANLAAIAIQNAHSNISINTQLRNVNELEWNAMQAILEEALVASSEDVFIKTLMVNLRKVIPVSQSELAIALKKWGIVNQEGEQREDRIIYTLNDVGILNNESFSSFSDAIAEKVLQSQDTHFLHDRHQVYIPLKSGRQTLGVIYLDLQKDMINHDQQSALNRLAAAASLALGNLHRQDRLRNILSAAKAVTEPTNLEDTLHAIMQSAREALPELSALTIWYWDPNTEQVRAGPMFGVLNPEAVNKEQPAPGSIVWEVMNANEPIWAENVQDDTRLTKRFVYEEGIVSSAAFPLKLDQERIGAMFFNYRHIHRFLPEEKALLGVLAEFAAMSIRDAIQLEAKRRESERLDAALTIAEAAGTTLDLNKIIDKVLEKLLILFKNSQSKACLLLYDSLRQKLNFAQASRRYYPIDNPNFNPTIGLELNQRSIATRVALRTLREKCLSIENIPIVSLDNDYYPAISTTRSEICASLFSEGSLLGILVLESPQSPAFDKDAEKLIQGIAQQISVAIDRSIKGKRLQTIGLLSTLTAWEAELAHDVNREVWEIKRYTYRLNSEFDNLTKVREYADGIDLHADRLASMAGINPPANQNLVLDDDLPGIIKKIMNPLKSSTKVVYELNCPGVILTISPMTLQRTIRHLVRNAIEAMDEQGTLTIRTLPDLDNMVEIQIEDNGHGIDDDTSQSLFVGPVTTKPGTGGHGLLVAQMGVERMGGRIQLLSSSIDTCTIFSVHLPKTPPTGEDIK